jgi:hypothetical protein
MRYPDGGGRTAEVRSLRETVRLQSGLGNLAATLDQLAGMMRRRLARIQREPALIAGFFGQTG